VAALLALALLVPPVAGAHLSVTPPFLTAGEAQSLVITVHNDRDATMTGFELTVPAGFAIASISTAPGWSGGVEGRTATWTGGALPADTPTTFELAVEAPADTGQAMLEGSQLYRDGEDVDWPLAMTVVPAGDDDGAILTGPGAVLLGLLGLLVLGTAGFVVLRRRAT
jgi:uncharacterized protein YcnI